MALALGALILLAWMGDLSKLKDLEADFDKRVSLIYTYSDGSQMRVEGDRPGPLIDIATLPPHVVNAVLAAEDRHFYRHSGYRATSILAAALQNLRENRAARGASTITQQLVKDTYGDREKSILRKIREVVIASQAESHFRKRYGKRGGKDRILALYMSRIELGFANRQPVLGFEDAAERYYGRSARELTLGQSALIAGMLLNWGQLNPLNDYPAAKRRRDLVLRRMHAFGFIDSRSLAQALAIEDRPIDLNDRSFLYTLDSLRSEVVEFAKVRSEQDDLRIRTTIDAQAQQLAAQILARRLTNFPSAQAAFVAIDGSGAIRVMLGGRDYGARQFNAVTNGRIGLGSVLKPFIFLTAARQGATPMQRCADIALPESERWPLRNSDGSQRGQIPLVQALAQSSNLVAVRLAREVGREPTMETLKAVGFPQANVPSQPSWPLAAHGSLLQVATAYAPFSNGGKHTSPRLYDRIETVGGVTLKRNRATDRPTGISEKALNEVAWMLRQAVIDGTGRQAGAGIPIAVAGKTGTTNDNRDTWFVGFGRSFVVAVWVGWSDAAQRPPEAAGGQLPAQIFHDFIQQQRSSWITGPYQEPTPPSAEPTTIFRSSRPQNDHGCAAGSEANSTALDKDSEISPKDRIDRFPVERKSR